MIISLWERWLLVLSVVEMVCDNILGWFLVGMIIVNLVGVMIG